MYTENFSFICYDIESLFKPYGDDEDNKKYIREHIPWLIAF
jgi:hypothetical protein